MASEIFEGDYFDLAESNDLIFETFERLERESVLKQVWHDRSVQPSLSPEL